MVRPSCRRHSNAKSRIYLQRITNLVGKSLKCAVTPVHSPDVRIKPDFYDEALHRMALCLGRNAI